MQPHSSQPIYHSSEPNKRKSNSQPEEDDDEGQEEDLSTQLGEIGLKLREIHGDGNCLFRALGDQLEGTQLAHMEHRRRTVEYMIGERKYFEPFVDEDDYTFEEYVAELGRDGTYAGNDAIVAFARNNKCDIVIHQLHTPTWTINGGKKGKHRPQLHIAYLNGDHYLSVRKLYDESGEEPANINLVNKRSKESVKKSTKQKEENMRKVWKATGMKDMKYIEQKLAEHDHNVEYTINIILGDSKTKAEMEQVEDESSNEESSSSRVVDLLPQKKCSQEKGNNKEQQLQKKVSTTSDTGSVAGNSPSALHLFFNKLKAIKF